MSSQRKIRVGLDVDGVLYPWDDQARKLIDSQYGVSLPPSTSWNSIQNAVSGAAWAWLFSAGGGLIPLFSWAFPYPDSVEAAGWLYEHTEVVIISHVPPGAIYARSEWLQNWGFGCHELHLTQQPKYLIRPHCDIYIDDSPRNATQLRAGTDAQAILLWDRPWNRSLEPLTRITRVDSWKKVKEIVGSLKPLGASVVGGVA